MAQPAGAAKRLVEYGIPTGASVPDGVAAGPDGNVWFTEAEGNKVGEITPEGAITEYSIPTQNSLPTGITAGPDGNLWFTENTVAAKIGKITPDGVITEYRLQVSYPIDITA